MSVIYEVDGPVFLERTARARRLNDELQSGRTVNVEAWSKAMTALLVEVDPIPLVIGVRYRLKVFGGSLTTKHKHIVDSNTGETVGAVEMPSMDDFQFIEIEGVYRGRHPDGPWHGLIALDIGSFRTTAIADIDVQRAEER